MRSLKRCGTYNFAGDIGKMAVPAAVGLLVVLLPWRGALALVGVLGLIAAMAIFKLTPRLPAETAEDKARDIATSIQPAAVSAFPLLLSIGVIDSATRMAFLLFLPFAADAERRQPADSRCCADDWCSRAAPPAKWSARFWRARIGGSRRCY